MDVTWLAKYAAAGWLEPLDPWFDSEAVEHSSRGPGSAITTTAISIAGR